MPSRVRWHVVCHAAPQQPEEAADDAEAWPRDRLMRSAWAFAQGARQGQDVDLASCPDGDGFQRVAREEGGRDAKTRKTT